MNGFNFQSHRTQLVVTALTASFATAGLFSFYATYSKRVRRRNLDRDVHQSVSALTLDSPGIDVTDEAKIAPRPLGETFIDGPGHDVQPEELIREQLARNYAFFGAEGMKKIRHGTVVIVGCGGVGSWAAVMLVRS